MTQPLPDTAEILTTAREHLQTYRAALGHGPDSPTAITAGWHLHRDVGALLALTEQLLAASQQTAR